MSFLSRFKTDLDKAAQGVWVDLDTNTDGSMCSIKLARASVQNIQYQRSLNNALKEIGKRELSVDENDRKMARILAETVLVDWKNFQPTDDGVCLPHSKDEAYAVLVNPAWHGFKNFVLEQANEASLFAVKDAEEDVKN